MTADYYLDESGTTGDLARSDDFTFAGQRVFTLAGVRIDDPAELQSFLADLRSKHKIQGKELKAKNTVSKPAVVMELIEFVAARDLPIFIEVVDKRFHIIANLVNHGLRIPEVSDPHMLRVAMAEYLAPTLPDHLLGQYCRACVSETAEDVENVLGALLAHAENGRDSIQGEGFFRFARRSVLEFASEGDPYAFLPPPDTGKHGRLAWMLPEMTSLMGIYARLNRYHRGELDDVRLFHDEHAHFDQIFQDAKAIAEGLAQNGNAIVLPFADYRFRTKATLEFRRSVDTPGIQLADVLAGFVRRYIEDSLAAQAPCDRARHDMFDALLRLTVPSESRGINFVVSERDARLMQIPL